MRESVPSTLSVASAMTLLREATRLCLNPAAPVEGIAGLCREVNWTQVLWLGRQYRGLLFLEDVLRRASPDLCPPHVLAQMKVLRSTNELVTMNRGREWCGLQDELSLRTIPAILASGPAFAISHYPKPALRENHPVAFVIVHPVDRPRTEAALLELGYKTAFSPLDLEATDRSLIRVRTRIGFGPASGDSAWERVEHFSFGGRELPTLSPIGWLLHLCWVSGRELWSDLRNTYDIGLLLKRPPSFDWNEVMDQARRSGLERSVLLSLKVAQQVLDLAPPDAVAGKLSPRSTTAKLAAPLTRHLAVGPAGAPRRWTTVRLRVALQPGPRRKLRSAWWHLQSAFAPRGNTPQTAEGNAAPDGLYCPTPPSAMDAMLRLAEIGPGDLVCDLGCGDGRIVNLAAEKFGARGLGIDSDPRRIAEARAAADTRGLSGRTRFVQGDLMKTSVRGASVVCVYLQGFAYEKIWRKLRRELSSGARVVSHDFTFPDRPPDRTELVRVSRLRTSQVYLWRIP